MRSPSTSTAVSRGGHGQRRASDTGASAGQRQRAGAAAAVRGPAADRLVPGPGAARPGARERGDRRHQRQGHRRPRPAGEDLQGPGNLAGHRMREGLQHLRRHRHGDDVQDAGRRRTGAVHEHRLHRQRLDQRPGGQQRRRRHRAGRDPAAARRPLADQARLRDRQGEPHLRPGARRPRRGQRRPRTGAVRPEDHPQPARAGQALRRPRRLLRRGHAVGRRAQLDRAGRGQRLRREGVRGVLPLLPRRRRRRARLPARRLPLERGAEGGAERQGLR